MRGTKLYIQLTFVLALKAEGVAGAAVNGMKSCLRGRTHLNQSDEKKDAAISARQEDESRLWTLKISGLSACLKVGGRSREDLNGHKDEARHQQRVLMKSKANQGPACPLWRRGDRRVDRRVGRRVDVLDCVGVNVIDRA